MIEENIPTKIKMQMAKLNFSQTSLSEKSGVTRQIISKIINGQNWNRNTMVRVLKALELEHVIKLLK